jgi:2-aminomuconate deaminase
MFSYCENNDFCPCQKQYHKTGLSRLFVNSDVYLSKIKAMSEETRISTAKAPKPVGLYPHARKVGNLLFLSGVGPRVAGSDATDSEVPGLKLDKNGNFIEFDFEAQCRSVFDNVRVILEESGSSWDQLVDVTVFLVNMKRDFHVYNRIYAEYFKDNLPCRTTVEINSLPTPIAIELKCIATIAE